MSLHNHSIDSMHWERIFDQSPIGIALVDKEGHFIKVNSKLASITGYSVYELTTMHFQDITHVGDLVADQEMVKQCILGLIDGYTMNKRYITKMNKVVWIRLTVSVIRDESNDEFIHFMVHIEPVDVTNGSLKHAVETLAINKSQDSIVTTGIVKDWLFNNVRLVFVLIATIISGGVTIGVMVKDTINKIHTYENSQKEMMDIIMKLQKGSKPNDL